jgi:uncharacterized protein YjiS (DUF1127 family)
MQAFINTSSAARAPRSSRRHSVINELDRLSDRELADIGLARGDIRSIFSGTNAGR